MILRKHDPFPEPSTPRPRFSDDDLRDAGRLFLAALRGDVKAMRSAARLLTEAVEAREAALRVEDEIGESLDRDQWPDSILSALVALGELPPEYDPDGGPQE